MCLNGISFNLLPFVNSSLFVEYGHRKYWKWEDQVSDKLLASSTCTQHFDMTIWPDLGQINVRVLGIRFADAGAITGIFTFLISFVLLMCGLAAPIAYKILSA